MPSRGLLPRLFLASFAFAPTSIGAPGFAWQDPEAEETRRATIPTGEPSALGGDARVSAPPAEEVLLPLPLAFVENLGQWEGPGKFVALGPGIVARLEADAIALNLAAPDRKVGFCGVVLRLRFEGASLSPEVEGEHRREATQNFFLGGDPARWKARVPAYGSVFYRGLYAGIDLRWREGPNRRIEYDLLVTPGADLGPVTIRCEGADGLRTGPDGTLVIETAAGEVSMTRPLAWQEVGGGSRRRIPCGYRILGMDRFGFDIRDRDAALSLIVDPGLV